MWTQTRVQDLETVVANHTVGPTSIRRLISDQDRQEFADYRLDLATKFRVTRTELRKIRASFQPIKKDLRECKADLRDSHKHIRVLESKLLNCGLQDRLEFLNDAATHENSLLKKALGVVKDAKSHAGFRPINVKTVVPDNIKDDFTFVAYRQMRLDLNPLDGNGKRHHKHTAKFAKRLASNRKRPEAQLAHLGFQD